MPLFQEQQLRAVTSLIVSRMGSDAAETALVTDHLVRANLAGHDSHGVGMLPIYVQLLRETLLVPNQTLQTVLDFGALLVFEAGRGFGQRMAAQAVDQAIVGPDHGHLHLGDQNVGILARVARQGDALRVAGQVVFIARPAPAEQQPGRIAAAVEIGVGDRPLAVQQFQVEPGAARVPEQLGVVVMGQRRPVGG